MLVRLPREYVWLHLQAEHFSPQNPPEKKPTAERGTAALAGNQLFGSMKVPASPIPGEGVDVKTSWMSREGSDRIKGDRISG